MGVVLGVGVDGANGHHPKIHNPVDGPLGVVVGLTVVGVAAPPPFTGGGAVILTVGCVPLLGVDVLTAVGPTGLDVAPDVGDVSVPNVKDGVVVILMAIVGIMLPCRTVVFTFVIALFNALVA